MKVLHVIARMNVGGTATYLANLISGLESLGVSNLLVMGNVPKGEAEDSVVEKLKYKRVNSLSREINFALDKAAKSEIERVIEQFKPDVIHTHTFKAGFLVRMSRRQIPVIHSFHGHHLYDPEFGFIKRLVLNTIERILAKRALFLITVGKKVRDELLQVRVGKPNQYVSIAPGINNPKIGNREELRKKLGFSKQDLLVVWLGRFTQVKRPDKVIELARLIPEVHFVLAGGGELLEPLKTKATENVSFLGFQDKDEMWSIADIALCTSDSEGMPLALIEAQMAGIPVVSTNVGSVSEIVMDGVTGMLSDTSIGDLYQKLSALISELRIGSDMDEKAREHAKNQFSVDVMSSAHFKLYRRALGKVSE